MSGKWSPEDIALAWQLKLAGKRNSAILQHFPGRTPFALESLYRRQRRKPSRPDWWRKTVGVHSFKVPDAVWAERNNRINEYRTPAQEMMGDPPPSQSALGRPCE